MLYDIEQVAIKLNVSKQTIYNKIKLNEFKNKIIKKQGKTYIDEELLKLIQDSLKFKSEVENNNTETTVEDEVAADSNDLSNLNKELITALLEQLNEKDTQIHELHKLIENNQVLLKDKSQQNILQLEEHFQNLDNKLMNIRVEMEQRKEKKKGFFKRIFSRATTK